MNFQTPFNRGNDIFTGGDANFNERTGQPNQPRENQPNQGSQWQPQPGIRFGGQGNDQAPAQGNYQFNPSNWQPQNNQGFQLWQNRQPNDQNAWRNNSQWQPRQQGAFGGQGINGIVGQNQNWLGGNPNFDESGQNRAWWRG